jgi:hypothetical protein
LFTAGGRCQTLGPVRCLVVVAGVFAAVLDAAKLSNNWILIDRTRSSSATAELLRELAIELTNTRPTVVVVDSIERLAK